MHASGQHNRERPGGPWESPVNLNRRRAPGPPGVLGESSAQAGWPAPCRPAILARCFSIAMTSRRGSGPAAIDAQPGLELACRIALAAVPAALLVPAVSRRHWVAASIQICVLAAALALAPAWR